MKTLPASRLRHSEVRKPVGREESTRFGFCIFYGHILAALGCFTMVTSADPIRAPIGSWRGENGEALIIAADRSFNLQRSDSQMRAVYSLPDASHIKIEFVTRAGTNSTTYSFAVSGNELVLTNDA